MRTKHTLLLASGSILFTALVAFAGQHGRGGYETPDYQTSVSEGAFEVRDYPSMVVATSAMPQSKGERNSAFMTLFGYISGKNDAGEKIAMTSPVFTTKQKQGQAMSFVVPTDVAKRGAPEATDPNVTITTRPAGRFATYRYSGRWTEVKTRKAREALLEWTRDKGYETLGSVEIANYDPPFTPPFLRRNEVLVRIKE